MSLRFTIIGIIRNCSFASIFAGALDDISNDLGIVRLDFLRFPFDAVALTVKLLVLSISPLLLTLALASNLVVSAWKTKVPSVIGLPYMPPTDDSLLLAP